MKAGGIGWFLRLMTKPLFLLYKICEAQTSIAYSSSFVRLRCLRESSRIHIGLRWTSSAMTHDSWKAIKCSPPETGCSKNLARIRWNIWRHEALRSRDFLEKKLFRRNRSDDWWSEFLPVYFSLWFPDNSLHRGMWFLVLLVAWITACKLMCSND